MRRFDGEGSAENERRSHPRGRFHGANGHHPFDNRQKLGLSRFGYRVHERSPGAVAGVDGSRTHRGPLSGPPPVLKTGEPTGTQPPPREAQGYLTGGGTRSVGQMNGQTGATRT